MTNRQIRRRFATLVALGILGVTGVVAWAAEAVTLSNTFFSAAEKFGIFAAMNLGLVVCVVYGLWRLGQYIIGRMEEVIDDNSMANLRLARQLKKRPCQLDSEIDRISEGEGDEDDSNDQIAQRIIERRKQRAARKVI